MKDYVQEFKELMNLYSPEQNGDLESLYAKLYTDILLVIATNYFFLERLIEKVQ